MRGSGVHCKSQGDKVAEQTFFERAIVDGHAELTGEDKSERVRYIAADHSERWADPEEKIRAEFWAELIYKYEYSPDRMQFEMKVPRRTPNDFADLVIYEDDALKSPYFVFECKRADISDAEFSQSIEQACGNRASLGAQYSGAVAGLTRRLLRFDKFPAGERDKNHLTDIPKRYGRPPEWRFYKNKPGQLPFSYSARRAARRNSQMSSNSLGGRAPKPDCGIR